MKKTAIFFTVLALVVVLTGCANLGDALKGKFSSDKKESGELVAENEQQEIKAPEAGPAVKYNNIFFGSTKYDPDSKNCNTVYWVNISGSSENPVERNISLLLVGPTNAWQKAGYYSSLPTGVKLLSSKVEAGTITLDFSSELKSLARGSCEAKQAKQQITMTAKYAVQEHLGRQADKVIVTVDGQEFKW